MIADHVDTRDAGALFSPCRRWRYLLWRRWNPELGVCMFVGLNPSTADEAHDDPTVRRMIGFARDWGYGSCWVLNAFAWRATYPGEMKRAGPAAVGPRNNEYLMQAGRYVDLVVVAWGCHGAFMRRDEQVYGVFSAVGVELHHLGLTKDGHPKHPLYLARETRPQLFS